MFTTKKERKEAKFTSSALFDSALIPCPCHFGCTMYIVVGKEKENYKHLN